MTPLLFVANWKMYKTLPQAQAFLEDFLPLLKSWKGVEVALAPPYTLLHPVGTLIGNRGLALAAQNCHWEEEGAYTGEVSVLMLVATGCRYVILGHSERRQHFGETSPMIQKKLVAALGSGLLPILCVGETLQERGDGRTQGVLENQMEVCLDGLRQVPREMVIAYEPVWAIGTGRVATVQQIREAHGLVHQWIEKLFKGEVKIRVLYGGSVNSENVGEIMAEPGVQGALVGGASLQAKTFALLIERALSARGLS
jgi:triosephosphate isomerase